MKVADDFDIERVTLSFDSDPGENSSVEVWHMNGDESLNDCIIRSQNPSGMSYLTFEGINGFKENDWARIVYSNQNGVSIRGLAILEL